MAKKRKRKVGEFEGALCGRCGLDLDPHTGKCPNDRCPFHHRYQDEIVPDSEWPSEEEWEYIRKLRERLKEEP